MATFDPNRNLIPDTCTQYLSSAQDMIAALIANNITDPDAISATMALCPDMCKVAWGEGNPDLAGVGLYYSYWIQFVLTHIFIVLAVLNRALRWHAPMFLQLRRTIAETNIYLGVAVIVSAVGGIFQRPTLYERAILTTVTELEMNMMIVGLFAGFVLQKRSARSTALPKECRMLPYYLIYVFISLMAIFILDMPRRTGAPEQIHLYFSNEEWEVTAQLNFLCVQSDQAPPTFDYAGFVDMRIFYLPEVVMFTMCWYVFSPRVIANVGRALDNRVSHPCGDISCFHLNPMRMMLHFYGHLLWLLSHHGFGDGLFTSAVVFLHGLVVVNVPHHYLLSMFSGILAFMFVYFRGSIPLMWWKFQTKLQLLSRSGKPPRGAHHHLPEPADWHGGCYPQRMPDRLILGLRCFLWLGIVGIFHTYIALMALLTLCRQRKRLQTYVTNDENEWGVGQIAAMLSWLPLVSESVDSCFQHIRKPLTAFKAQFKPMSAADDGGDQAAAVHNGNDLAEVIRRALHAVREREAAPIRAGNVGDGIPVHDDGPQADRDLERGVVEPIVETPASSVRSAPLDRVDREVIGVREAQELDMTEHILSVEL